MKEKVIEELRYSVAIVLAREEVVPRFRVVCPEGDLTVFVPLPDDMGDRQRRMQLVYGFMAWKSATAFVMSSELIEPDCLISAAVNRADVLSACRPIVRRPCRSGRCSGCQLNLLAKRLLPCCRAGEWCSTPKPRQR